MKKRTIPLARPDITDHERQKVMAVLHTPYLSMGPMIEKFEERVAAVAGTRYAVAVSSGTAGLHILVRALGLGAGDEVITTSFSFIASSNCLLFEGVKPVFAEIDEETLNIDPARIEEKITPRTKAILPVHVFGRPADMEAINEIARRHNLKVIEDACEAIGASRRGIPAGKLGDGAVFAYYPNKQITTGEGGTIVTDNPELYRLARTLRNQGRSEGGGWFDHERLGFNYRFDELSAALGLAQIERLDEILEKRERVAEKYNRFLSEIPGVRVPHREPDVKISWFVYVIRLEEGIDRDRTLHYLQERGISCKPYFCPIHLLPFYKRELGCQDGDLPLTEKVARTTLALPFYNNLSEDDIAYIASCLREAVEYCR
ncbi:MAG: DegT/DnrJ/EryC1/StrS family aminotransferase [Firmicutes bacterium]|nr:DegT/DnrJ/EryC1/StrS family aminotransferase [Bacillota bacterium]